MEIANRRHAAQRRALAPYRWPLLLTAVVAAIVAIGLLALALLTITWMSFGWDASYVPIWEAAMGEGRTSALIRSAIAIVGIIVGAGAAVIAYRNQQLKELAHAADRVRRLEERFVAAADQIGNTSPAVRIAGLYAMAQLAASWPDQRATQQCVDVICGYLRMPVPTKRGAVDAKDREVRRTALRIIASYTARSRSDGWGLVNLDLTGATVGRLSLVDCALGSFTARGATFEDELAFHQCSIAGEFDVREAVASARVILSNSNVAGRTFLDAIHVHSSLVISNCLLGSHLWLNEAHISGLTAFDDTVVSGQAGFKGTTFQGKVRFDRAEFRSRVDFLGAQFLGQAKFGRTSFKDAVSFADVSFERPSFVGVEFKRATWARATRRGVPWSGPTAAEMAARVPRKSGPRTPRT